MATFSGMQVASIRSGVAAAALLFWMRGRVVWSWPTLAMCFVGRPDATATAPDPAAGDLLGVICSLTWALTLVGLRWGERSGAGIGISAVVVGNAMAFAAGVPFLSPLPSASAGEWATLAYLGVFQIAVAYIFLTSAAAQLPALDLSLLLLLEPVLNPIWTWLVRGEDPGTWTLFGGAIIVAATAGKAMAKLEFVMVEAQNTLRMLSQERELAERIEQSIKQLRGRTGANAEEGRQSA